MGRAQYRLRKHVREEQSQIEKAGAKRGLWSKIGMALGGLIAIGLTGGAAAPAVAALAAGVGTAAGGFAGRQIAAKSKGGKIRGGKFFQDERESLIGQIDESIWAGAAKTGLTAGASKFLGGITPKFGWSAKGGLSITAGAGKAAAAGTDAATTAGGKGFLGKAFEGGESAHTYSDSLLGKVGKALDVKGSTIGQQRHVQNLWNKPDLMTFAEVQGPPAPSDLIQFADKQGPPVAPPPADTIGRFKAEPLQESLWDGVDPNPRGRNTGQWLRDLGRQYLTPGKGLAVDDAGEIITDAQRWPGGYKPAIDTGKPSDWHTKLFGDK